METKRCTICRLTKKLIEFTPKIHGKFGVTARCKNCLAEIQSRVYLNNKEYYDNKSKEFKIKNPNYNKDWTRSNMIKSILRRLKHQAKRRNIPFDLKEEDIVLPTHCPVLGIELKFNEGKAEDNSYSVDKIIPEKGYVKSNIIVISRMANRIKTDATIEQLIKVANFYKNLGV